MIKATGWRRAKEWSQNGHGHVEYGIGNAADGTVVAVCRAIRGSRHKLHTCLTHVRYT